MENQDMPETYTNLPVLPRLDRLDRLLQLLEEKHSLSGRRLCKNEVQKTDKEEDKRKTLSSALDEVQLKGTLMERLAMLENSVLKLCLDMDEGNTSKSSSTAACSEKLEPGSESSTGQAKDEIMTSQGMQSPLSVKEQDTTKTGDLEQKNHYISRRHSTKQPHKRWLGCLRLGC